MAGCAHSAPITTPTWVLFVGNGVVYAGNLPAVIDAPAFANHRAGNSDMIVKDGAALSERVADGPVDHALSAAHYDYVALQERGGDVLCGFNPDACKIADDGLAALASTARAHGHQPWPLGTYQFPPKISKALVETAAAASRLSMPHISVSDRLQVARKTPPNAGVAARRRRPPRRGPGAAGSHADLSPGIWFASAGAATHGERNTVRPARAVLSPGAGEQGLAANSGRCSIHLQHRTYAGGFRRCQYPHAEGR